MHADPTNAVQTCGNVIKITCLISYIPITFLLFPKEI